MGYRVRQVYIQGSTYRGYSDNMYIEIYNDKIYSKMMQERIVSTQEQPVWTHRTENYYLIADGNTLQ